MGWELFSQYVRALREAQPSYFLYENNKSMSKAIRQSITDTFGFEPICINSALVSAQNRQRLYWVGKRNADGTYSKCEIEQPEDRGVLLRDVLDGSRIPEYGSEDKARPVTACYAYKGSGEGSLATECFPDNPNKQVRDYVAEPVGVGYRGRMDNGKWVKQYESNGTEKANALTTAQTDSMVAQRVGSLPKPNGELSTSQSSRVYSVDGKSVNLTSGGGGMGAKTGLYAIPVEFNGETPTKAVSTADGKEHVVYAVKDGKITIKGKSYPIKLVDGFYIIRKLTVTECMRLQTVPKWYEFPVSDSQAYKMLGNGWTVEVIAHLIKGA